MKNPKITAESTNVKAADFGDFANLSEYVLPLAPGVEIPGKVFGGSTLGLTGGDFSFQTFAPGTEGGFYHTHKTHEELYFFLAGKGEYQVDGKIIPVQQGSVVRVSPAGKRAVRNTGSENLVMLCVQYRGNTMTAEDANDGVILQEKVEW